MQSSGCYYKRKILFSQSIDLTHLVVEMWVCKQQSLESLSYSRSYWSNCWDDFSWQCYIYKVNCWTHFNHVLMLLHLVCWKTRLLKMATQFEDDSCFMRSLSQRVKSVGVPSVHISFPSIIVPPTKNLLWRHLRLWRQ